MLKCTLNLFLLLLICFAAISAKGQVTAGFTLSDTAGCAPIIVHFTNTSTGATSYFWDLGNGTTTSATNASASYTSAGSYTVTLTAYNSPATSVYTKVIKGIAAPSISFSASSTAVCPAIPITFISTSIANYPGPMTYIWNFGDGSSSTANSPVYAYFSPGSYNTTLFARNNAGCISSLGKPGYVTIYAPATVGFNAAATSFCNAPGNVSFTNTTTGAGPLSYTWQFGDGSTSPGVSPAHTYGTHGTYDV
jgi:PKD repeat protein